MQAIHVLTVCGVDARGLMQQVTLATPRASSCARAQTHVAVHGERPHRNHCRKQTPRHIVIIWPHHHHLATSSSSCVDVATTCGMQTPRPVPRRPPPWPPPGATCWRIGCRQALWTAPWQVRLCCLRPLASISMHLVGPQLPSLHQHLCVHDAMCLARPLHVPLHEAQGTIRLRTSKWPCSPRQRCLQFCTILTMKLSGRRPTYPTASCLTLQALPQRWWCAPCPRTPPCSWPAAAPRAWRAPSACSAPSRAPSALRWWPVNCWWRGAGRWAARRCSAGGNPRLGTSTLICLRRCGLRHCGVYWAPGFGAVVVRPGARH